MKAVLISIQPEWCELIASGKKTVEVRKTKPKLETPFKVYIYMTAGNAVYPVTINNSPYICSNCGGKEVIGEFVCDEISEHNWLSYRGDYGVDEDFLSKACLNYNNMREYGNEKKLYAWHISDLVIYDTPKELREFTKPYGTIIKAFDSRFITRPPQSWCYVERLGDAK